MGLKGLFFKDEPENGTPTSAEPKAGNKTPAPQPIQAMPVTSQMVSNMTGVADEKFVEMLMGVIAQNNIPGQDYFEFKQTIDAMASLSIDERTKFLTIFTTFNLQGCTKETLLTSIDKYISVVNAEHANFNAELQSQRESTVTSKINEIENAKKKLEALNKEIVEANTFIMTASQEVQNAEIKLQMTEGNFKRSVEKVIGLLTSDKDKINAYIQ